MPIRIRALSIPVSLCLLMLISCASDPEPRNGIGIAISATSLDATAPNTEAKAVPSLALLPEDEVKCLWGRRSEINPFLPQEKSITGKQYEVYPLKLASKDDLLVTILGVTAYDYAGAVVGRTYDQEKYIEFWLARIAEEDVDWERKRRTIEKYVPYYGSAFPLYSDRSYVLVVIAPKDAKVPARYTATLEIDGAEVVVEVSEK